MGTYFLRRLVVLDAGAVEQEANRSSCQSHALAVGIHQFRKRSSLLDLEVNFFSVLEEVEQGDTESRVVRIETASGVGSS